MQKVEKKCPRCKKDAEGLIFSQGIVVVYPCWHPVIHIETPISKALGTICLLGESPMLFSKVVHNS